MSATRSCVLSIKSGETVAQARRLLARAFVQAGIDTPDLDARLLTGHALGLDHAGLASSAERPLGADETERLREFGLRRLAREPIAHILGTKEFWGLRLRVTAATLTPRPDTETIVEAALALVDASGLRAAALRIADLGTGSGAILLALLSELPNAYGIGVDLSTAAIAVARSNAARLGLERRSAFVIGDFSAALAGDFGLVVSNPPYIASGEITALAPEVRDHEPWLALDGGDDGLAAYRAIAADAARLLAPGGHLIVEIGQGQALAVTETFEGAGLRLARLPVADLAGTPRALILTLK
jgi:release factor glutamine methyltransferase